LDFLPNKARSRVIYRLAILRLGGGDDSVRRGSDVAEASLANAQKCKGELIAAPRLLSP
jgi:hypothetical protein